jgi:MFS family permease
MRRIHSPVLLGNLEDARARAFVVLFTCDAFARSILISLVPLQAYELLGAAQLVSVVYFPGCLRRPGCQPDGALILHLVRRRWVLTIGAAIQIASVMPAGAGDEGLARCRLALQMLAMAMLDIVINLYLLDHIPRRRLNHFEPRRLLFAGTAFAAGPWVGVYLSRNVAENLPILVAALATCTMPPSSGPCGLPTTRACRQQRHRRRARSASCSASSPNRAWSSPGCWRSAATAGGSCTHLHADLCGQRRLSP